MTRAAPAVARALDILELIGHSAALIAKADSTKPVRVVAAVGARIPARASALGQALLAGASLVAGAEQAVFEHDEAGNDVRSVAVPVRDHTGQVIAALGVTVPATRAVEAFGPLVRQAADQLSQRLGYQAEQ